MLEVLAITAPTFMLIAIGYVTVRLRIMSKPDVRILGFFALNFAMPAMLFKALSQRPLDEIVNVSFLAAYALGALAAMAAGMAAASLMQNKDWQSSVVQGMGMSVSNAAFIGFPIAAQVFGPIASVALGLTLVVDNLLMLPLLLILAEAASSKRATLPRLVFDIFRRSSKNPLILAMLAGLVSTVFKIRMPVPAATAIDLLAVSSSGVALFVVGGTLAELNVKSVAVDIGQIVVGKLLLHPLVVFVAFMFLPRVKPELQMAGILLASVPMMSIYPILGQKYGKEGLCTAALVAATIASFFTLPVAIWMLRAGMTASR